MIKLLLRNNILARRRQSTQGIIESIKEKASIKADRTLFSYLPRAGFCVGSTELARYFKFDEDSEIIEKLFRGKHRLRHNFKRGDVISNFHVEEVTVLKEFNICVYSLRHNSS